MWYAGREITPQVIQEYLDSLRERGRTEETLKKYRRAIALLDAYLPKDTVITQQEVDGWRDALYSRGAAPGSITFQLRSLNTFFRYLDGNRIQVKKLLCAEPRQAAGLTRTEYLRILKTARHLGKERLYLAVKTLGCIELLEGGLSAVTVEAVREGKLCTRAKGKSVDISFPAVLQADLLRYIEAEGLLSGPVFRSRNGTKLDRSNLSTEL